MFHFEELDLITRKWMLEEFLSEQRNPDPYRSPRLTSTGLTAFPVHMETAIKDGDETSLAFALLNSDYWLSEELGRRGTKVFPKRIDPKVAAPVLAFAEFNTWYVRGLARRLMEENVQKCQVYRAAHASRPRGECAQHEEQIYNVKDIYDGHRARYWPQPGNPSAFCIPVGTNCHHSIRRLSES
jgi:hypothetical protein